MIWDTWNLVYELLHNIANKICCVPTEDLYQPRLLPAQIIFFTTSSFDLLRVQIRCLSLSVSPGNTADLVGFVMQSYRLQYIGIRTDSTQINSSDGLSV